MKTRKNNEEPDQKKETRFPIVLASCSCGTTKTFRKGERLEAEQWAKGHELTHSFKSPLYLVRPLPASFFS